MALTKLKSLITYLKTSLKMTILFSNFLHTSVEVLARVFLTTTIRKNMNQFVKAALTKPRVLNTQQNACSARISCTLVFVVQIIYRLSQG